jgi:hypothetical protein
VNKKNFMEPSIVAELGLSDHHEVLLALLKNSISIFQRTVTGQFGEGNTENVSIY